MIERVVALAILAATGVYLASAWTLPQGTAARPGAGMFPVAVGLFGMLVTLTWLVSTFRHAPAVADSSVPAGGLGRVTVTSLALVGFCLVLPWLGYAIVAFLFAGVLLRRLGAGWTGALLIAGGSAAVSYYLFAVLLGVPLPRGIWLDQPCLPRTTHGWIRSRGTRSREPAGGTGLRIFRRADARGTSSPASWASSSGPSSASCPASVPSARWRCSCRPPLRSSRRRGSSCSRASTTARCTAARPRPSSSTSPGRRRRS